MGEYYLSKVGNDYDQYMLVKEGRDDTIAIFFNKHTAELTADLLNQMLEKEETDD